MVAGIEVDSQKPGYKHVLVQPRPGGGLEWVKASVHSIYGDVSSFWELKGQKMTLRVVIPANTTATIRLPHARLEDVLESGAPLQSSSEIRGPRQVSDAVVADTGSGSYVFEYKFQQTAPTGTPEVR